MNRVVVIGIFAALGLSLHAGAARAESSEPCRPLRAAPEAPCLQDPPCAPSQPPCPN